MLLLMIVDSHGAVGDGRVDFSAFKTFQVREGYRTTEVDARLNHAVQNAIRAALTSRGIKETPGSPDLIANYRVEVTTQQKEVTGIVVIDLTNVATDRTIWHGQHIDDAGSSAKLEKRLPDAIKKMLSDNPTKKK